MDDPSIPGFRSLTQAGIQLREGEGVAPPPSVVAQPQENNQAPVPQQQVAQPNTNPLPLESTVSERRGRGVTLQPREPGTKRPLPRDLQQHPQVVPMSPGQAPPGIYLGQMPALQFSCPCCGVVLTITEPSAYHGQPGPCPGCTAVVMPPQVVSPFALAGRQETERSNSNGNSSGPTRHYSGFVV